MSEAPAEELVVAEEVRLREIFDLVDIDHSGSINKRELIKTCRGNEVVAEFLGLPTTIRQEDGSRAAIEEFFQGVDNDNSRTISWEEFRDYCMPQVLKVHSPKAEMMALQMAAPTPALDNAAAISASPEVTLRVAPEANAAYEKLRSDVDGSLELIQQLRLVLQAEQDRGTAFEAAAAADRQRLEELADGLRLAKLRQQEDIHTFRAFRKDVNTIEAGLLEARGRIDVHDGDLASAQARLGDVEGACGSVAVRAEALEGAQQEFRASLNVVEDTALQQGTALVASKESMERLEALFMEAEGRAEALAMAHAETSRSLAQALDQSLAPALERAESERKRVDEAFAKIAALATQGEGLGQRSEELAAASQGALTELAELRSQILATASSLKSLEGGLAQAVSAAGADHEHLGGAVQGVEALRAELQDTAALLRKTRSEVAEVRAEGQKRAAQVNSVVEALAALQAGLSNTDGEVYDVRSALQLPPRAAV